MTAKNPDAKYHVPALEKGLDILEALAASSAPLTLTDLARELDRSSSELFRMLSCLENRSYLYKDEQSGRYSLSMKLFELAYTHAPVKQILQAAERPMRELAHQVRESVHLSVLSNDRLVVIAQELSPEPIRLSIEVGGSFSAVHTSSGRLLLAQFAPERLTESLNFNDDYQVMSTEERDRFHTQLQTIREQGYFINSDQTHYGVRDTVVPVGNAAVGLLAALAIGSLAMSRQPQEKALVEPMLECARTITAKLGLI
jgi:DNA-binding IclR family transcriptional regulator